MSRKRIATTSSRDPGQVVQAVLDAARRHGADAAEADIDMGGGLSVNVRNGEVETVEHQEDKALGITVYLGKRKGSASSTDFSEKALDEIAAAACTIARYASEDPCNGLVDPRWLARDVPDLDLHHPWALSADAAIEMALECEQYGRERDARISNSDGTSVSTYSGTHHYGNTGGFTGGWRWSSHGLDCTLIAESAGGMQRDGWYTRAREAADMENPRAVAEQAATRTCARLDARRLGTRTAPVLFEAPVAASLFRAFLGAISGASLYRKASFLLDAKGTPVFAGHVSLRETPHLPRGMGSAPFDSDGMATREKDIVRDGVVETYLLSAYSARKLGLEPTGNADGVHNLVVSHGDQDLDSLLRSMDTGLLVTDLIGFGVNQVTGDYSRGAAGFWIEGGAIRYPVEEITIAGNLKDMYRHIAAIGNDVDRRGNILTGSVLVEGMTIAGE